MKILITSPIFSPETRGPAIYLDQLIPRLHKLGHKTTVITFTSNPKVVVISKNGGTISRQLRLLFAILKFGKTSDLIYAQGADVVGLASVIAGKLLGKKVVIKFVGDLFDELQRDFGKTNQMVRFTIWVSLHLANKIIFPARHLQAAIINRYKIPPEKTTVIYNAIA